MSKKMVHPVYIRSYLVLHLREDNSYSSTLLFMFQMTKDGNALEAGLGMFVRVNKVSVLDINCQQ